MSGIKLHWAGRVHSVKEDDLFDIGARMERHMTASEVLACLAGGRLPGVAFAAMFREALVFLQVADPPKLGELMRAAYAEHAVVNTAAKNGLRADERHTPIMSFIGAWAAAMFDGAEEAVKVSGVDAKPQENTPKKKTSRSRAKPSKSASGSGA